MKKYYKNMILCSDLDYHCLYCKESFETIPDLEKHIRWEKHRQCIKQKKNVSKYKEFIYKIEEIYYCEICNRVIKSKALQEHMKSDDHIKQKGNAGLQFNKTELVKRDESGSIKFPKLSINRLQWHGIHNRKCLLCKDGVDNVNDHLNTTKHMVHIIQGQIVENNSDYFRKTEDNKFYCFGCSDMINEDINKHNCKKQKTKKTKKGSNKDDEIKRKCEPPEVLDILVDIMEINFDINIKEKTAKCKLCDLSVDVTFSAMDKHKLQYHEDTIEYIKPQDHGKLRCELAKYGKENFIKLNEGGSKGYCSLCDIYISAHMRVAKEHVNGLKHRGLLEIKGLRARKRHSVPGCRTVTLQQLSKDIFHAKPLKYMCINFMVCVKDLSFMFVTDIKIGKEPKRKCYCCDMIIKWDDISEHLATRKHKNAFVSADVLLMDDEFIRVIRPGLFHCGLCNQVFPFWEAMGKHVASRTHGLAKKMSKAACTLALQWYIEQKTKGTITFSDDLYLQCLDLGVVY